MGLQESEVKVYDIPVADIYCDNDFNCRGPIQPIDVLDLVRSIEKTGLEQPIVIQPWIVVPGKKYRVVAGHRRYTAFVVLKWPTIPSIIKEQLNEFDARRLNLEENLKRKDLNFLQIARALRPFIHAGWTQDDLASELGQPKHWVHVCCAILKLPEDIQQEVAAGYLTQEHIKQLAALNKGGKKDAMYEAIRKIKQSKMLGERKKIEVTKKKPKPFSKAVRTRSEMFDLMGKIQDNVGNSFATRVLAWAAGEITEFDIHRDLRDFCAEQGVQYEIPAELMEAALGTPA
jgi:ParB family transcriptional regulator, chromosome partitioning protein